MTTRLEGDLYRDNSPSTSPAPLLFIFIFVGNIILRHLMRVNFPSIMIPGVFHARHERVAFLDQLVYALRIRGFDAGQSLQISRLPTRRVPGASGENRQL